MLLHIYGWGCSILAAKYESVATARFRRWVRVSSNLKKRPVWKSLVATCGCVGLKFERTFSTRSFPALKPSALEQKCSSSTPKVFICSTINAFIFYLEGGLENPSNEWNVGEKSSSNISFQLRMKVKKGQKVGRYERTKEDCPTFMKIHIRCWVVFFRSFISA